MVAVNKSLFTLTSTGRYQAVLWWVFALAFGLFSCKYCCAIIQCWYSCYWVELQETISLTIDCILLILLNSVCGFIYLYFLRRLLNCILNLSGIFSKRNINLKSHRSNYFKLKYFERRYFSEIHFQLIFELILIAAYLPTIKGTHHVLYLILDILYIFTNARNTINISLSVPKQNGIILTCKYYTIKTCK